MHPMAHLWDKQREEGPEAFEAFCAYRDSVHGNLSEVARGLSKSHALLRRWSRTYDWQARREAWLGAKDTTSTQAQLKAIGDTEEQRAKEVAAMNERHATYARMLAAKVGKRLSTMSDKEVAALKPKDLAHWLDVAVKVERLARGVNTEQVAVTGQDGGAIEVDIRRAAEQRLSGIVGEVVAAGAAGSLVGKPN